MIDETTNHVHKVFVKLWPLIAAWWLLGAIVGLIQINIIFTFVSLGQGLIILIFAWAGRTGVDAMIKKNNLTIQFFQKPVLSVMRIVLIGTGYIGLVALPLVQILMAIGIIPGKEEFLNP